MCENGVQFSWSFLHAVLLSAVYVTVSTYYMLCEWKTKQKKLNTCIFNSKETCFRKKRG